MLTSLNVPGISDPLDAPPFLEILIIYDDVWSGSQAVHVVSTLNERLGSHVSLEPRLWPFNCLDDEDSFDLALAEGIKADLVLIAVGETFQPRDSFKQWLKLCVDRKRGADSAIVLMQEGQPVDSLELAGAQFIRRTALDAGLDFISSQCVQSESAGEGKAARFSAHGQGETASRAAPSNLVSPGRDSNILYVEDDPLQRRLCAMLLVRAGYEVTAAANAFEAWEELNSATFDLLVTDNEMQQFTGLDLVVKARAAGLALPIIIASGSASLLDSPEYDWLKFSARLQKPFDANQLLATVQEVLGRDKKLPTTASQDTASAHRLIQQCRSVKPHSDWGINE